MATYSDDFNRAELGPDWTVIDGTWSIHNGSNIFSTGGAAFPSFVVYNLPLDSLSQRCDIVWTGAENNSFSLMGPAVRRNDSNKHGYWFLFRGGSNNNSSITKTDSGGNSILTDSGNGVNVNNQILTLEISNDNVLKSYVNGVLDTEYEDIDSPISGYNIGLVAHSDADSRGDDFFAEDLAVSETPGVPTNLQTVDITATSARFVGDPPA